MNPSLTSRRKAMELRLLPIAFAAALATGGALAQPVTNALPVLNPGSTPRNATIGAQTGTNAAPVMNINQNAPRGVIEWQSFDIGAAARVNIVQPNAQSVLVNRVINPSVSATSSQIYGTLSANGRVFLVNPAGVTFGPGAQVNVGSLVASTLDLAPAMTANNYEALIDPATSRILLAGTGFSTLAVQAGAVITTDPAGGGSVVLVDNGFVSHDGRIDALRGRVAMGVGTAADVVLPATASGFVDLVVTQRTSSSGLINLGASSRINAEGGSVVIGNGTQGTSARNDNISLNGIINVGSTTGAAGTVHVDAGDEANGGVTIGNGGTIAAMGTGAGQTGGSVTLLGSRLTVAERSLPSVDLPTLTGATIDVSGSAGGGTIVIGDATTRSTTVGAANILSADATASGNGGRITLAANYLNPNATAPVARVDYGVTEVYGTLAARGGLQGGNGGQISTSGQALTTRLDVSGDVVAGRVDASARAAGGTGGTWTIDPFDVTISNTAPTSTGPLWTPTGPGAQINAADISSALNAGTNVEINTGSATVGNQAGTITVATGTTISRTTAGATTSLTLRAHDGITLQDRTSISGTDAAPLTVNLFSDLDGNGTGGVAVINSSITTGGGNVTISGGVDPTTGFASGNGQQGGVVLAGASISTTTGTGTGGNVVIRGRGNTGTPERGVSLTGFTAIDANDTTILGVADRGSGVYIQDSFLSSRTGTIDVRGVATRTGALSTQAIGVEIDGASFNPGQGSVILAGRGDDNNVAGTYPAATGIQYSDLRINTGPNSTGTIRIAGEAANSTGAGITFNDVESGGLVIRDGTSTAIPTLANVSIGAISSDGLALALGIESSPGSTNVLTTGTINFRPVSVDANGQMTDATAEAILVGSTTSATSGFVVDPASFGTAFRADTGFVIGSSTHAGRITVENGALAGQQAQTVTLQNEGANSGGIALGTGIDVRDLGLLSAGAVTQAGGITVDRTLLIGGGGTFALASTGNTVGGTVALAAPGSVDLLVDTPLVVNTGTPLPTYDAAGFGTRQPTDSSAVTSATLRSNGTITVSHDIVLTGGGNGTLALVAPDSVSVDTESALSGPRVQVWSRAISWVDGARVNYYGCTYPTCSLSGITPPATGRQALFPDQPTVNVVADNLQGTVGGTFPPFTYTSAGLANGDSAATALAGALGSDANSASPAGAYAINQGTLVSPTGYVVNYTPGTLTLTGTVTPPAPQTPIGLEDGREMIRSAFLTEYRSDVYGRNLAQPFICTAASVISESVAREGGADPLASEWGKVRNQPQLSGCLDVASGGQCAAF